MSRLFHCSTIPRLPFSCGASFGRHNSISNPPSSAGLRQATSRSPGKSGELISARSVRYETVEERRQAMIAKGWSPAVLAALEEAMEPKFLRDMREEDEGQGEAEH
jgi:hypothetical protein